MINNDRELELKSYWVLPGKLLAGEYPGSVDGPLTRRRLRWLLDAGINRFIDLTEPGEAGLKSYLMELMDEAGKEGAPVEHTRFPVPDMDVPSSDQMKHILDALDNSIKAGERVYVHCYGGKGRTGTVVGCYLVRHGKGGEAALQQITSLRKDISHSGEQSPETQEQRDMVRNWTIGQ
jgi:protein tyrosine/serine phosphatase